MTSIARRGVAGFDPMTGRELWRFDPPRTQRSYLTFAGSRVLVATDAGVLYGLDGSSGRIRFTVRSSIPFAGPAVRTGRRAIAVLKRTDLTAVYVCEALASGAKAPAGTIAWTRELALSAPSMPVATQGRIFLTGHREGRALVVALSLGGRVLWERPTPLDPHSQLPVAFEGGVVVTDARGHAVRLLPDGQPSWVLGGSGDQLSSPIAPVIRRRVLVVPGPTQRASLEPAGHRAQGRRRRRRPEAHHLRAERARRPRVVAPRRGALPGGSTRLSRALPTGASGAAARRTVGRQSLS